MNARRTTLTLRTELVWRMLIAESWYVTGAYFAPVTYLASLVSRRIRWRR